MYAILCCIGYIKQSLPSATAPCLPYTLANQWILFQHHSFVCYHHGTKPVLPFSALIPTSAKYVNGLSHSTLTPSFIRKRIAPDVINVTLEQHAEFCLRLAHCRLQAPGPAFRTSNPLDHRLGIQIACADRRFTKSLTFPTINILVPSGNMYSIVSYKIKSHMWAVEISKR